jgi:bla regulator protein blaR1
MSLNFIADHLWQSTLFAGVAGLLTRALRKNPARARHWIWFAASVKFLIPFSLFVALGSQIDWRTAPKTVSYVMPVIVDQLSEPFTASTASLPAPAPAKASWVPTILLAIWLCGAIGISCSWLVRWRRIRAAVRAGSHLTLDIPIKAMSSPTLLEPGVFGIFRPVLLLPAGITERLNPEQLKAVLAHELCHVRYCDNLTAAVQMFAETVFWFHPLVWWIGKRMVVERERACDEEVLRVIEEPQAYAEGILNVCKLYAETPLRCVSGITGSNLKHRIEAIMKNSTARRLSFGKKLALAVAATTALAVPIVVGIVNVPVLRAQSQSPVVHNPAENIPPGPPVSETPAHRNSKSDARLIAQARVPASSSPKPSAPEPAFEVAAIKPAKPLTPAMFAAGQFHITKDDAVFEVSSISLMGLITMAYEIKSDLVSGPGWLQDENFSVAAKVPAGGSQKDVPAMLRRLLADRFKLAAHLDQKIQPVFFLKVAKQGPRLSAAAPDDEPGRKGCQGRPGHTVCRSASMADLANVLTMRAQMNALMGLALEDANRDIDLPVVDQTDLAGAFDFDLEWIVGTGGGGRGGAIAPARDTTSATSIIEALQAVGLRLERGKHPFDFLVIDHVERPSEN